jgi:hypothetical protein
MTENVVQMREIAGMEIPIAADRVGHFGERS